MGMQESKTKTRGFTLAETIIALGILAIIAVFLFPSLNKIMNASKQNKDRTKIIYAMQMALEKEKSRQTDIENEVWNDEINGVEITISRSRFEDNLEKIKVTSGNYELEVVEVINEEAWFYTN